MRQTGGCNRIIHPNLQKHLDMIPPLLRNEALGKPRVSILLIFAITEYYQTLMEDFTQPYASQGDIDYSLCLITQGRNSLETEWWKLAPDGNKLFFIKKKKEKKRFSAQNIEMLPRQWHQLLLLFLVLSEDAIHRFLLCYVSQVKWYSLRLLPQSQQ